jgi:flagellar motility protein MotE (MotC chaperone)
MLPFWLVLAAAGTDPLSPPPLGSEAHPPVESEAAPEKPQNAPANPANPGEPKSPAAAPAAKTPAAGKAKPAPPASLDEPEGEPAGPKTKIPHKPAHKQASADRPSPGDRKSAWSADRYAAVVPPGLTLAALRAQLAKGQSATAETSLPVVEGPGAELADIERAREALRQETARLEAMLKSTANCGGAFGMPIGEGLATAPVIPAAVLRETPGEQIDSVSKALKGMKPEQAAPVVARLDRGLAAEIMLRMKPADAGAILGLLKPELAAELTTQIATRRSPYAKDRKGTGK